MNDSQNYFSKRGGFSVPLPEGSTNHQVLTDSAQFFAVRFSPPHGKTHIVIQRFRSQLTIENQEDFEAILEGVLLGIKEGVGSIRILEQKVQELEGGGWAADLVLRVHVKKEDTLQRRRLIAPGVVPPNSLFLISGVCSAEAFLVYRREFEEMIAGFAQTSTNTAPSSTTTG